MSQNALTDQVGERGKWTQDFLTAQHKDGAGSRKSHERCQGLEAHSTMTKEKLQVAKMEEEIKVRQEFLGDNDVLCSLCSYQSH